MTAPHIPPIKVDIVEGQNTAVPALQRTGTEIARVAGGAGAALSPVQRIGKALALSESREGSVALRGFRTALDELAGRATGASAGIARLAQSILGITGGAGVALLGIGVLAAAGAAYQAFTADARDLEEQHKKAAIAVDEFNKRTAGAAGQIRARLSGQGGEQPSFLRILAGEFGIGSGGAHIGEGLKERLTGLQSEAGGLQAQIDRTLASGATDRDSAYLAGLRMRLKEVQTQAGATAREIGSLSAELKAAEGDVLARASGRPTIEQAHLATVAATRDARQETERARLTAELYGRGITDLASPQALDAFERQKQGWAGVSEKARDATEAAREFAAQMPALLRVVQGEQASTALGGARRLTLPGGTVRDTSRLGPFDLAAQGLTPAVQAPIDERTGTATAFANTVRGAMEANRETPSELAHYLKDSPKEVGKEVGASVAAVLGIVSGARRGGAEHILAGGGAALSALSQLTSTDAVTGKAKALIPGLGPVGTVISGLASLTSLFSSGQAKFKLADIEEQALRKLRDVLQIPQNVSATFVGAPGGSAADTKKTLDRLAAKTGVTTLPGIA